MSDIQDIFSEYARMRENGLDTKSVLSALRPHIESLDKSLREELSNMLRQWEARSSQPAEPKPAGQTPAAGASKPVIKRLSPPTKPVITTTAASPSAPEPEPKVQWVNCPNCGKPNQKHEVFCYACGQLLEPTKGSNDTQVFDGAETGRLSSEFFGPDSVLVFRVRGSAETYEVRPQQADHEIVVGRSAAGSAMSPDIDLVNKQAADLGVSRFHLSIRYDLEQKAILAADLGSANGSFINGQRLLPKEVRVLRHADELRLGRLTLMVSFRHPGKPPT